MIAFSATSTLSIERVISNNVVLPKVIKFQSEYEMVNGASPIQDAIIERVTSKEEVITKALDIVVTHFDMKPIIIIHNEDQLERLKKMLEVEKLRFTCGYSEAVMTQIRVWDYGVLLLERS